MSDLIKPSFLCLLLRARKCGIFIPVRPTFLSGFLLLSKTGGVEHPMQNLCRNRKCWAAKAPNEIRCHIVVLLTCILCVLSAFIHT